MTDVDICNLALSYIGNKATVASIDPPEGSAEAQHCSRFYPIAVKSLLEMHDWNFATTRAYLALMDNDWPQWAYAYKRPSNVADIISIIPKWNYSDDILRLGERVFWGWRWAFPWELGYAAQPYSCEVDATGQQIILTNVPEAVCRYTVSDVKAGLFTAQFCDALAQKLGSMLAGAIIKGDAGAKQSAICMASFKNLIGMAMVNDANQQRNVTEPQPAWIRGR